MLRVKNWYQFLKTYSDGYSGKIIFRNGLKLFVDDSSDISSISTSFFRNDYGKMDSDWKTIIDIGAHKGYFSIYAATNSPRSKIYSFEPIKKSFDALSKNIKINNLQPRIKAFNLGVANKPGSREINVAVSSTDNSFYTQIGSIMSGIQKIECTTLSDIFKSNEIKMVDLLKLDCEGAEFEILMVSDKKTLSKINEIRMEYHNIDRQKNILKLESFLKSNGFDLHEKRKSTNKRIGYARFVKV